MYRIIRSRSYGKTYDLIKFALENDCAIICCTQRHKKHIEQMSLGRARAYTVEEWNKEGCHQKNNRYVVDELELVVECLIGGNMVGWNMSME